MVLGGEISRRVILVVGSIDQLQLTALIINLVFFVDIVGDDLLVFIFLVYI